MARIIQTGDLTPSSVNTSQDSLWIYNGLDCCLTHEIFSAIEPQLTPANAVSYSFKRAMQAPAMEMMLRGMLIDEAERWRLVQHLQRDLERVAGILNRYADALWDKPINPRSPTQLGALLYDHMKLPEVTKRNKYTGVVGRTTDEDALEKLSAYFEARPVILAILKARELQKDLESLRAGIDNDGRMRYSLNVVGTETDRWSSSKNIHGTGRNIQNVKNRLRRPFIPDVGMKFAAMDLAQAESRVVGILVWACTGDSSYYDACLSGDLHTTVAKMVWPELEWTGDPKHDRKEIAERSFYRHWTYRDMAKRGGHGTNYYGQPPTMAKHLRVPISVMVAFQQRYFRAFPGIPKWHSAVATELQTTGRLTTPLGNERHFLGRLFDDATLREAIAHVPQSTIVNLVNTGLWQVWRHEPRVNLLVQGHDSILFQYPEALEREILPRVQSLFEVPFTFCGRDFLIPSDIKVGWNWADYVSKEDARKAAAKGFALEENEFGLRSYSNKDDRQWRHPTQTPFLDRLVR